MAKTNSVSSKGKIIDVAFEAFSRLGYKAVTMRYIAGKCGMSVSSLYHHFSSKSVLYEMMLRDAYAENSRVWHETLDTQASWQVQLREYLVRFCRAAHKNPEFISLIKREQLEGEPRRIKQLAESILAGEYARLEMVVIKANPRCEPHICVMAILGTALHFYETSKFRTYFPDYTSALDDPDLVAEQISNILIGGLQSF